MVTSLEDGSMSSVEVNKEEAFYFLMMASIFERVKKVTGSRKTSDECFVVVGPSLLVEVAFHAGWPSLDVARGMGVGILFA